MRLLLVYNPIAGRGRASARATRLAQRLRADAHDVRTLQSAPTRPDPADDAGDRPDAIIVLGGDGTVHAFSDLARRVDAPVYQFPLGTENLFAREFGMDRRYETLRGALERGRVERVDVATCNAHSFLLMVSIGPDANIIHRLARVRDGSIRHMSYLPHILAEVARPGLPPVTVTVDGRTLVEDRVGLVVVANSRQYALRIDPAKDASMSDGQLDVVFFPVTRRLGLIKWMALSRLRMQNRPGSLGARGREIVIEAPGSLAYQFDGEAGEPVANGAATPGRAALRLGVQPGALPVLVP